MCAHMHSAISRPSCTHWWDLAQSMLGRSWLPQGTAPGRIWLPEGSGSVHPLVPSPVGAGWLGRTLSLMCLSSLPSPRQQKEETRLGAQVSACWAGWAAGSPSVMQGTGHGLASATHCIPLKAQWELPTLLEAAEPTRWQWDTAGFRCSSIKGSQSPPAKSPFLSSTPNPPRNNRCAMFLHPMGGPGEAGCWGVAGRGSPGPQGWGWEVPCSPLKGTYFPPRPPAATALHPSARRRKRRLERNTDVTGRMDTTSGWGQRGWMGTERAGWGQKGLLGTVGLGGP